MAVAIGSLCISAPATAAEPAEDKRVCKRVLDTNTGSNFRGTNKVCRLASEWKQIEEEKERTMRKIKDGGGADPNHKPTFGGSPG